MQPVHENKREPDMIMNANLNFVIGADVSHLLQLEDFGARFYDDGVRQDCLRILKNNGFNAIRIISRPTKAIRMVTITNNMRLS